MSMLLSEQILGAVIIALLSGLVGKILGEHGKVSKLDCEERQSGCMKIVCVELAHIKDELKEIKNSINPYRRSKSND